jgi:hypothetical protein
MRTTVVRVFALAALAGSLTACGGDKGSAGPTAEAGFVDKAVPDIETAVVDDMKALSALRVSGTVSQGGKDVTMDLALTKEGSCEGTMSFASGKADLRGVDGAAYLKGDADFWTGMAGPQGTAIVSMLGDKWAKVPGNEFASFCDLDEFLKEFTKDNATGEKLGASKEVAGFPAVEITGDKDGNTTSVWVATSDPHYVLELTVSGKDQVHFTLSDFGKEFDIQAPADDEVVDLSKMAG